LPTHARLFLRWYRHRLSSFLALVGALVFGASDFLGGVASRRGHPAAITFRAQIIGAAVLLPVTLAFPTDHVRAIDLWCGALAGGCGGIALLLFYAALARGAMAVVAPLAALAGAIVPVTWGLVSGERPGWVASAGVVLALVAIPAVSRGEVSERTPRTPTAVLLLSLVAGLGFGGFAVSLSYTETDAGLWPLMAARAVSVPVVLAVVLSLRAPLRRLGPATWTAAGAGVLDVTGNALILVSLQLGQLTIAAVLAGLYPASTVVLARLVLQERISRVQLTGLLTAGAAVALIALA
jgi:drug/metabolite transporter (DMT)-like permease